VTEYPTFLDVKEKEKAKAKEDNKIKKEKRMLKSIS
jgi:hypothetical protein